MRHQIKITTRILFSGTSEQSPENSCFSCFFRAVSELDRHLFITFYGILIAVLAWGDIISVYVLTVVGRRAGSLVSGGRGRKLLTFILNGQFPAKLSVWDCEDWLSLSFLPQDFQTLTTHMPRELSCLTRWSTSSQTTWPLLKATWWTSSRCNGAITGHMEEGKSIHFQYFNFFTALIDCWDEVNIVTPRCSKGVLYLYGESLELFPWSRLIKCNWRTSD